MLEFRHGLGKESIVWEDLLYFLLLSNAAWTASRDIDDSMLLLPPLPVATPTPARLLKIPSDVRLLKYLDFAKKQLGTVGMEQIS